MTCQRVFCFSVFSGAVAGPAEDAAGAEFDDGDEFGVAAGAVCGVQADAEGEVAGLAAGGVAEAGCEDAGGDRFGRFADGGEVPRAGLPAGVSGYAGRQRSFSKAARGDEEAGDEVPGPVLECFQEELFPAAPGFADEHEAGDGGRAGRQGRGRTWGGNAGRCGSGRSGWSGGFWDAVAVDFFEGVLDVGSSDFGDGHGGRCAFFC